MTLRRPSGSPPPAAAELDGRRVDLAVLAADICRSYHHEYPDERARYGPAGDDWCRHDNQWLLCWAINDVIGAADLDEQVRWLARVLHARDFPLSRLAHNLRLAADVVAHGPLGKHGPDVSARLSAAAATVAALDLDRQPSARGPDIR